MGIASGRECGWVIHARGPFFLIQAEPLKRAGAGTKGAGAAEDGWLALVTNGGREESEVPESGEGAGNAAEVGDEIRAGGFGERAAESRNGYRTKAAGYDGAVAVCA